MFYSIRRKEISESLLSSTRQYLAGNLSRPQSLTHFVTPSVEIGITSYPQHQAEPPHRHGTATEFQYVLSGWTKYLDLDSGRQHEFRAGDFYVITPETTYAQKSKAGTEIIFVKVPSINDKETVPATEEVLAWMEDAFRTIRTDYFHQQEAPPSNSVAPAAAVAVVHDNQILMIRRNDNGRWALPGGTLGPTESLPQCAVRELREETGLHVSLTDVVGTYTDPDIRIAYSDGEVRREFTVVYLGRSSGGEVKLDSESSDYAWVPVHDLLTLDVADSQLQRLQDIIYYLQTGKKAMR